MSSVLQTDLAWAAGIIDGEGCIGLNRISQCHWSLRIQVGNTDIRMLNKLQTMFGGSITLQNKKSLVDGYKRKPLWVWVIYGEKAENFLLAVQPYLVVKADQAEIGIHSRRYLHARKYTRKQSPVYTEKIQHLERLSAQLSQLKENPCRPLVN